MVRLTCQAYTLTVAFCCLVAAQTEGVPRSQTHRIALIIGNKDYARPDWTLANPINDARAMAAALIAVDFEPRLVLNATLAEMRQAVKDLADAVRPGDVVVFYYAGHGVQLQGEDLLIPVDFSADDESSARVASYSVESVRSTLERTNSRLRIIILDTCRSNPFRPRSLGNSLLGISIGEGTFVALAAGPGAKASDGGDRRNGLFTSFLVDELKMPGLNLQQIFADVRAKVKEVTKGNQWPLVEDGVIGTFYFRPPAGWVEREVPKSNPVPLIVQRPRRIRAADVSPERAKRSEEALVDAQRAIQTKHYSDAVPFLEKATALNPASVEAHRLLGRTYYRLGNYAKAAEEYTEAIEDRPQSGELYRERGLCYSEMRNYVEAISDLTQAIALDPKDWQNYWLRSQARDPIGDHLGSQADDKMAKQLKREAANGARTNR